ncbi:MAG: hypothetical protein V4459_05980 [Pseudomonadota bacterium]
MLTILALALAANALPPVPDGTRLRPTTQCFAMVGGGKMIGATFQRIRAVRVAGRAAWDIVIYQRLSDGRFDMRDHFVLARRDLRPIAFDSSRFGKQHIALTYGATRITGTRVEKDGSTKTVDVPLTSPVWEGNLWGVTFGAMPLGAGATLELPFYQYDKGFDRFHLAVTGSEIVDTPSGKVAAWTVDVGTDPKRIVTYLIDKKSGAELGTRAGGFETRLGGDCRGMN